MADILTVIFVAAGAQLAVLPGEKVQLIIASLSTRYHPILVVSAAGTAFAGWTVLEIQFGNAIQNAIPGLYLDLITAGMFGVFALLLWRSVPERRADSEKREAKAFTETGDLDVSLFGRKIPNRFGGFLPIFVLMAAGEFGDKTQLITITLAGRFGAHPGIWIGEMIVIVPVSLANAYFFHTFAHRFNRRKAYITGAVIFAFFAIDTLLAVGTGLSVWESVVDTISGIVRSVLG